jgi:hypothetical protein
VLYALIRFFLQGESILNTLIASGRDRKIKIRIVQNTPKGVNNNTDALIKYGKFIL